MVNKNLSKLIFFKNKTRVSKIKELEERKKEVARNQPILGSDKIKPQIDIFLQTY